MARQIKTSSELNNWMTAELQSIPHCAGSELKFSYALHEPDVKGCNWTSSGPGSVVPGPDISPEAIRAIANGIVARAQALFNIDQ